MREKELRKIFIKSKNTYPQLEDVNITLILRPSFFSTMRAHIHLLSLLRKKRKYSIIINSNKRNILRQLNKNDYRAWFGHELAHIIDYESMNNKEIFLFLIRYLFDVKYRFKTERKINAFAYNNGFSKELYNIWKKFLSMKTGNEKYKKYIIKNYKPKWKDIEKTAINEGLNEKIYNKLS